MIGDTYVSTSQSMGMEVTDICMDKESDCVTVYSTVVTHDSEHETAPSDLDVTQSYDHNNGDPVQQLLEANAEVKECEVKECTAEKSIKISELSEAGKCEEVVPPPSCKESLPDEKMKLENQTRKDDNKKSKSSAKPKSRTGCGNARINCTVPQPFALATEKRASCGTRPTGIEPDAETAVSKSSNVNSLQHQHLTNKNQKQVPALKTRFLHSLLSFVHVFWISKFLANHLSLVSLDWVSCFSHLPVSCSNHCSL